MSSREDVEFVSGNDVISAWLYRPDTSQDAPLVVIAPGLAAVRTMRLDDYAERFAAAGHACLVFDYRTFGDSGGQPRQLADINMQLADWTAAVAYTKALPGIDHRRIALWGTSFSGGHVIATAAKVPGIAAVIAQCPFTDGMAAARTMNPLTSIGVGALALRDFIAAHRGRPPVMVSVVGWPGEVSLMSTPGAYPGALAMVPEGMTMSNEIAARFAIKVMTYRPGRLAAKVFCPILFCICQADSVTPPLATLRYAAKTPRSEVKLYPYGHHDIYFGAAFERAVTDQIDFLNRHLKPGHDTSPQALQRTRVMP